MTLGHVAKDVRDIVEDMRRLEDRVTIIETGGTRKDPNGSALTDEQTKQINAISEGHAKNYSEQAKDQAFNRLIFWAALAAFSGGAAVVAAVVFAYLRIKP